MRKRLAFISEHASPLALCGGTDAGGQNVVVAELSRHLARLGYSVDIFTRKDDPVLPEVVQWDRGVRVVHIPAGPPEPIPKEELLPYMDTFREGILRFSEKEGNPYRLIHAHFFMSALVAADIRKQTGIPFVVTFHALGMVRREIQKEADRFPASRIDIEKRVIAEADCVVALCPQDRRDLIRLYEADSTRIEQIPNGVDPEVFSARDKSAARERLGWTADERVLLQLGRMVPRKGIDTVIEALALLKNEPNLRLVIVGGETDEPDPVRTPEIGRLQALAKLRGVADRVHFTGKRDQTALADYYAAADVFVTTPWYEPFGITPLEAMACGVPVVGSKVGGIRHTVVEGYTGFLVPPKDPAALADRLRTLLRDPVLARFMGENGMRRVHDFYTWKQVAAMTAGLYERLTEARKPAVFLDKDGTLIRDVPYNVDPRRVDWYPDAGEALQQLQQAGFRLFIVSNQDGVAKGLFSRQDVEAVGRYLRRSMYERYGVQIDGFCYCPHAAGTCQCRKPAPGLFLQAAAEHRIDLAESWMIGDILNDVEAGKRAGCRAILLTNGNETEWLPGPFRTPDYTADSLTRAAGIILSVIEPQLSNR